MRITDGRTAACLAAASIVQQAVPDVAPSPEVEADSGPDKKASTILANAASGKRISKRELGYIAHTRPDQYSIVAKSCAERKSFEKTMHKARSKQEVRWAHASAVANAGKSATTAGEGFARVNQLTDARNEYMKTPEYWRKPDQTPVGKKRKASDNRTSVPREDLRPSPKSCEVPLRLKRKRKPAGGIS